MCDVTVIDVTISHIPSVNIVICINIVACSTVDISVSHISSVNIIVVKCLSTTVDIIVGISTCVYIVVIISINTGTVNGGIVNVCASAGRRTVRINSACACRCAIGIY